MISRIKKWWRIRQYTKLFHYHLGLECSLGIHMRTASARTAKRFHTEMRMYYSTLIKYWEDEG